MSKIDFYAKEPHPSAFAQTSITVAMRSAARVNGTHQTLPATANGLAIGVSTAIAARLGGTPVKGGNCVRAFDSAHGANPRQERPGS